MSAEDLKQIVSIQNELMASLIKTATQLQNANNELALARAVVEAARQILKCGEGLGFYALDRAIFAYDAAVKTTE